MGMTPEQAARLLKMIQLTHEVELTCTECAELFDRYAQASLDGLPVEGELALVREHLAACPFCEEECRLILETIDAIEDP